MDKLQKDKLLKVANKHIKHVQTSIGRVLSLTKEMAKDNLNKMRTARRYEDKAIFAYLTEAQNKKTKELVSLKSSPYFTRCDVRFDDEEENRTIYFSKFNFDNEKIYSWVAAVATIRFENLGNFSYERPNSGIRRGKLFRKDQYMIVNGKIVLFSTESLNNTRELIYQDYFSSQKTEFALPEVVAQIEKAQDQVIRAHHVGPMVITGPAGSGKTTLALHRIAYLVQSPETSTVYSGESIKVFVQDKNTKEYFLQLLPRLGIDNVAITTFAEWVLDILKEDFEKWGVKKLKFVPVYGDNEKERDLNGFRKIQAIDNFGKKTIYSLTKKSNRLKLKNALYGIYHILAEMYAFDFLDDNEGYFNLLKQQNENKLDSHDLTALILYSYVWHGDKEISETKEEYKGRGATGRAVKKIVRKPLNYSLIVVDEFQNYSSTQLMFMRHCNKKDKKSIIYVGDIKQRTRLGAIKTIADINENIDKDRQIVLQKVYRNTKNILEYIQSIGYEIQVSKRAKTGEDVIERICTDKNEEIAYIKQVIINLKRASIGVIAKDVEYLKDFKKIFKDNNIRFYGMDEVQGVEFDTVFIVGIDNNTFSVDYNNNDYALLKQEKKRINKDLLYTTLTRAVNRLYVLGQKPLKESVAHLF